MTSANETCILLIDDDESSLEALGALLRQAGYRVTPAQTGAEAISRLEQNDCHLIISDLFLPDMSGIEILKAARRIPPQPEVIVLTGHASAETAVIAMKEGAFDYLTKPLNFDELLIIIGKVLEKQLLMNENSYLRQKLQDRFEFSTIIGRSSAMRLVFERMARIIKTDSTVLITGESGTGKELVAQAIHHNGPRMGKPFVAVNCSAIPETLLESELFGHVRGAFTGAIRNKEGKFEAANHGTIFLDEIGSMPQHLQTKLLRVIQEHELERIGSNTPVKLNVRIISATNSDLEQQVRQGLFREDLYYRLNVIPLAIPPLRERQEDIRELTAHFLDKCCRHMHRSPMTISIAALEALERYPWPGNVRELENMIERMVALTEGDIIRREDLPSCFCLGRPCDGELPRLQLTDKGINLPGLLSELERDLISQALERSGGIKTKAAGLLQLNRTTLLEKMKRLGM